MPDSFMPSYSQSSQPDEKLLQETSHIVSDLKPNLVVFPHITDITDDLTHDLNDGDEIPAHERWEVQIVPSDPTKYVRGWLCPGSPAVAENGPMIDSKERYPICFTLDTSLSFIRDPLTGDNCKIYLNPRE